MEIFLDSITWIRLAEGLYYTFYIAFASIFISIPCAFFVGYLMAYSRGIIYFLCRFYLESVRIIPIIAWLFLVYFSLSSIWELSAIGSCILVFSLWGIAEGADLVRGAISSVPGHQIQSARALGLGELKIQFFIVIPQALLQLIPSALNLFTRMIKTTALASLIGVSDILKVAQQIIEVGAIKAPHLSFWLYALVFFIYYVICALLSFFAKRLEKRLDFRR